MSSSVPELMAKKRGQSKDHNKIESTELTQLLGGMSRVQMDGPRSMKVLINPDNDLK